MNKRGFNVFLTEPDKMTTRPSSVGPDSSSESGVGLPAVNINKSQGHPDEWTLPHEWNIEKRETFENWKMDVQNQIVNIAENLDSSLHHYPHPDLGSSLNYSEQLRKVQEEIERKKRERLAGTTLLYGLARAPVKTQF